MHHKGICQVWVGHEYLLLLSAVPSHTRREWHELYGAQVMVSETQEKDFDKFVAMHLSAGMRLTGR